MKRVNFLKHLKKEKCLLLREGARHSVFFNPKIRQTSTVPRHNEINNFLARKICRDLGVREVK
ncbi:MAG: addiction module toxin, HicA family [Candidatus Harrisonbacteria bacterium RIFCSPLOWO2_02_FULL_41_11]|uniref:Addiction module toxin, HicA family n=1 Tax=Candidatus Harrisonbacteria bacterium RIFCSPHIGHO2_02_FULL_42_16 TaxID=1798404 RepID=A0A1G1ZJ31_9BACT|nr:MAG: addiction module toxin, HicA family [Candidatus Harrisonbacteria bacterium RIFCSPHIGHO2_02_FULL_42_16]OGY67132.1 MAG: addiction module toxin, HicA family [Candidatus Harrisonbacteria bacterium RIFCSPLOWO2_02_FULL_41_11]